MFESDPVKPASSAEERDTESGNLSQRARTVGESDLADLTAKFAAHGGGGLSPELSAGLALDVVLNEIVEQACLATGATGAAVILERDGEMVCRASSGANAPELGVRLSGEPGLTAECIKTKQVQRCDDAQADPRADTEASRSLGVRSVLILPLLRNGDLAGVLEVFSSQPAAFGERDQLTLEALAHRILKNLERGSEPFDTAAPNLAPQVPPIAGTELKDSQASSTSLKKEGEASPEVFGRSPRTGFDVVTFALGIAVVACAALLGTLIGLRLGWGRGVGVRARVTNSASGGVLAARNAAAQAYAVRHGTSPSDAKAATDEGSSPASTEAGKTTAARTAADGSKDSFPPAGGLLIYENGKEVFRMPPAAEQGEATSATSTYGKGTQRASDVERAGILEVPPEVAEGSLLLRVEPDYPEEALQQRIQGAVVLDVHTRRDGTIQEVTLQSGQRLLADAAIAAVKQWRFRPRVVKGQPVEMQTTVTLNFRLPR